MQQKSHILDSSQKIFLSKGFKNVNMDDLSREIGISKKTLYLHFENKLDLIHQILENHIEQEKKFISELINTKLNPIQKLTNIQKHNYEMLGNMNPIALYELQRYFPQAWAVFENYKNEFILNLITTNYKEGISLGYYRPEINVNIIALFHIHSIDSLFKIGIRLKEINLGEIFKEYFNYHLRGIATEKGVKEINKILV